jgi:TIR domain
VQETWRIDPDALRPFNDAPAYLAGDVTVDECDSLLIRGRAKEQLQGWHNIGAESAWLEPESFEIVVSTISMNDLGACSTRIVDENGLTKIALSHFVRSSVNLDRKRFIENFYSGFGFDESGSRSQVGIPADWSATGRHHNVMLMYDHEKGVLGSYANEVLVHSIAGHTSRFKFQVLVQAVGVEGEFDFRFERMMYRPIGSDSGKNLTPLRCWLPEYSPTFVSYAHADKQHVDKITSRLRSKGVRVRGDWDFHGGDSLVQRISQFISRASFLVVALSPASVNSSWVSKELQIAQSLQLSGELSLRIVPIMLAPCEVPVFLRDTLRFDMASDDGDEFNRLLETLSFRQHW